VLANSLVPGLFVYFGVVGFDDGKQFSMCKALKHMLFRHQHRTKAIVIEPKLQQYNHGISLPGFPFVEGEQIFPAFFLLHFKIHLSQLISHQKIWVSQAPRSKDPQTLRFLRPQRSWLTGIAPSGTTWGAQWLVRLSLLVVGLGFRFKLSSSTLNPKQKKKKPQVLHQFCKRPTLSIHCIIH